MTYIARVNPLYLAAIACFAAKNDTRYYLNGICITPHHEKGVLLVATDGTLIGAMHDPDGWVAEEIIVSTPNAAILKACKARGTKAKTQKLDRRPSSATPGKPGAALAWIGADRILISAIAEIEPEPEAFGRYVLAQDASKLIDGKFPNWRQAMQVKPGEYDPSIMPHLNAAVLQPFLDAARILARESEAPIELRSRGENAVVNVYMGRTELRDLFFGAAMPMRGDVRPIDHLPAFITNLPQPKKPRARVVDGKLVAATA